MRVAALWDSSGSGQTAMKAVEQTMEGVDLLTIKELGRWKSYYDGSAIRSSLAESSKQRDRAASDPEG